MLRGMHRHDLDTLRIETPRLILRPPRLEDFDAWAEFLADDVATKFLGGTQLRSTAWRTFMCMCGCWHMTGIAMFSVIEKATGNWVGRLGPWFPEGWPAQEVGWGIAREHWGKGYASEGAAAAMDFAFDVLGFETVIHCIEAVNAPSIALAKSVGSKLLRSGVHAPAPFTVTWDLYGQSRDEWRARS